MKKLLVLAISVCMILCSMVSVSAASAQYTSLEEAAAAIGLTTLEGKVVQDSIDASTGFDNEGGENLFDDDVTTKFCTGTFPLYAEWKMDKAYSIGGLIVATANDNSSNPNRNPEIWTVSGSTDGSNWTVIYSGTDGDFEDEDYTYYIITFNASAEYQYFRFDCESAISGCFQMSELILCEAEAAPVVVEDVVAEAPAEEAPSAAVEVTPVTTTKATAPQTSDATLIAVAMAVIALAAVVVLKKKAVR